MKTMQLIKQRKKQKRNDSTKRSAYVSYISYKILASNLLKRKKIMADGNCLLTAVLDFLYYPMSVQELRKIIAEHIDDNAAEYIPSMTFQENLTPEEELENFLAMVEDIGTDGKWNTNIADFVPLCIANLFQ